MSLQKVGNFSLYNGGKFTARMKFNYFDENGEAHDSCESDEIFLGQSRIANLSQFDIPDGAMVLLQVDVDWGKNNRATRAFTYDRNCQGTAAYVIDGTALSNRLQLIEVRS